MTAEPGHPEIHLYQLFERVGALSGKVESILAAMMLNQQSAAARDERVETLERRMSSIEGTLATREDFQQLAHQVSELRTAMAESRGGARALGGFSAQGAAWAAVAASIAGTVIALLALVNSGRNTREILQRSAPPAQLR